MTVLPIDIVIEILTFGVVVAVALATRITKPLKELTAGAKIRPPPGCEVVLQQRIELRSQAPAQVRADAAGFVRDAHLAAGEFRASARPAMA